MALIKLPGFITIMLMGLGLISINTYASVKAYPQYAQSAKHWHLYRYPNPRYPGDYNLHKVKSHPLKQRYYWETKSTRCEGGRCDKRVCLYSKWSESPARCKTYRIHTR